MTYNPKGVSRLRKSEITVVCSYCSRILYDGETDEKGEQMKKSDQPDYLSHGMCPACLLTNYPNQYLEIQQKYRLRIKRSFDKGRG